jgi:hypothetical protein
MTQFSQGFRFDLANAFARDGEMLSDFFERVFRAGISESETHFDDFFLARRQRRENFVGDFPQIAESYRFRRIHNRFVFDKIAEMRIFFFANRRFERNRFLRDFQNLFALLKPECPFSWRFLRSSARVRVPEQATRRANQLVDRFDHMNRNANRSGLVGDGARDRLTNPPRRVSRKLVAAPPFEFIDGFHQTDVAFLNQIEKLQTAIRVFFRNRNDETQVGFDQFAFCLIGLRSPTSIVCIERLISTGADNTFLRCRLKFCARRQFCDLNLFLFGRSFLSSFSSDLLMSRSAFLISSTFANRPIKICIAFGQIQIFDFLRDFQTKRAVDVLKKSSFLLGLPFDFFVLREIHPKTLSAFW